MESLLKAPSLYRQVQVQKSYWTFSSQKQAGGKEEEEGASRRTTRRAVMCAVTSGTVIRRLLSNAAKANKAITNPLYSSSICPSPSQAKHQRTGACLLNLDPKVTFSVTLKVHIPPLAHCHSIPPTATYTHSDTYCT